MIQFYLGIININESTGVELNSSKSTFHKNHSKSKVAYQVFNQISKQSQIFDIDWKHKSLLICVVTQVVYPFQKEILSFELNGTHKNRSKVGDLTQTSPAS